jgi:ATP-dependent DNA ligase
MHIKAWERQAERKIGRNDPCDCDSGKKYKHCCAKAAGRGGELTLQGGRIAYCNRSFCTSPLLRVALVRSRSAASARLRDFVGPMKAKLVDSIRPGEWIYEIQFDGHRALAPRGGSETRVLSRNKKGLG